MSSNKTALVTRENKGIGFAIDKSLSNKGFNVFLLARDLDGGKNAIDELYTNRSNYQTKL